MLEPLMACLYLDMPWTVKVTLVEFVALVLMEQTGSNAWVPPPPPMLLADSQIDSEMRQDLENFVEV